MKKHAEKKGTHARIPARQVFEGCSQSQTVRDYVVGSVAIILTLGGTLSFFLQPQVAPQFWAIIGPIIVGAIGWTRRSKNHHE
ncbi:MAG: hypothetical protein AAB380_06045 [Verrucomicrobiota bacterium]